MRDVVEVSPAGGCRLRLAFDNGDVRIVDISLLTPFEGVFQPLRDPAYLARVSVNPDIGTIVWPNGADLCPDVLYERSLPAGADSA
jgi:hypothetical protein